MYWNGKGSLWIGKTKIKKGQKIPKNLRGQVTDKLALDNCSEKGGDPALSR